MLVVVYGRGCCYIGEGVCLCCLCSGSVGVFLFFFCHLWRQLRDCESESVSAPPGIWCLCYFVQAVSVLDGIMFSHLGGLC